MANIILRFAADGQLLRRTEMLPVLSRSENLYRVKIEFSREWAGETKTAVFSSGGEYYSVLLDGDECALPAEVLTPPGFTLSVWGSRSDGDSFSRRTANAAFVGVLQSGYADGETPQEPTQTVYEQILAAVAAVRDISSVTRYGDTVTVAYSDGTSDTFPLSDGVSVSSASVSAAGELIITLSDGSVIDAGHVKGDRGATGAAGTAATVAVGTVTVAGNGEDASVVNSGTATAATLDFTLPRPGGCSAYGENLLDSGVEGYTAGKYLNSAGELVSPSGGDWNVTNYLPLDGAGYYGGLTVLGSSPRAWFYDAEGAGISCFLPSTGDECALAQIPTGAAFVRFSVSGTDIGTFWYSDEMFSRIVYEQGGLPAKADRLADGAFTPGAMAALSAEGGLADSGFKLTVGADGGLTLSVAV